MNETSKPETETKESAEDSQEKGKAKTEEKEQKWANESEKNEIVVFPEEDE